MLGLNTIVQFSHYQSNDGENEKKHYTAFSKSASNEMAEQFNS
jgi:hypothetical protein